MEEFAVHNNIETVERNIFYATSACNECEKKERGEGRKRNLRPTTDMHASSR
jgi:hypothetical protein